MCAWKCGYIHANPAARVKINLDGGRCRRLTRHDYLHIVHQRNSQ